MNKKDTVLAGVKTLFTSLGFNCWWISSGLGIAYSGAITIQITPDEMPEYYKIVCFNTSNTFKVDYLLKAESSQTLFFKMKSNNVFTCTF